VFAFTSLLLILDAPLANSHCVPADGFCPGCFAIRGSVRGLMIDKLPLKGAWAGHVNYFLHSGGRTHGQTESGTELRKDTHRHKPNQ